MSVQVNVQHEYVPYTVSTRKPCLKSHHDAVFDSVKKPLCKVMEDMHGSSVPGCEEAAAFTKWSIDVKPSLADVYDQQTGKRNAITIQCFITTVMPNWDAIHAAPEKDQAEVRRFELRTAYHERGHGLTCERCAHAISRFLRALPKTVSVEKVAQYNSAAQRVIQSFYMTMGRRADVAYDGVTGHGLTQGAEAQDAEESTE